MRHIHVRGIPIRPPATNRGTSKEGIAYLDRDGSALPIVLVHGSGFSKEVFHAQFASERLAHRRLVAVDLPGHGASSDIESERTRDVYTYAGLAAALLRFLTELGIDECVVAGWSLGGQAALELVDGATCVKGVFAFGAAPANNGPLGLIQSFHISRTLLLATKASFTEAEARRFEQDCLAASSNTPFEPRYTAALRRTDSRMRPSISRSLLLGAGISQRERLERATVPTCLLHGGQDRFVRTAYLRSLAAPALHAGGVVVLPGSGHAPFLDDSARFDEILEDFVRTVERGEAVESDAADHAVASERPAQRVA